jgi:hypothetical protein
MSAHQNFLDRVHRRQRQIALSRWDNEGGAGPDGRPQRVEVSSGSRDHSRPPALTDAELVQLQIRVIALENLVIALLAEGSLQQLEQARTMADHISPRTGFTPHRQTIHAAAGIASLIDRAARFRIGSPSRRSKP